MISREEAEKIAVNILEVVVDCIAEKRYKDLCLHIKFEQDMSIDLFEELVEGYLELNQLPYIDKYSTQCNFVKSGYSQMCIYVYNNSLYFK